MSSSPIFNAGTEQFIRDWRSAIVTVTVRDSRNRQHDPILGVIPLKLSDVLNSRSQATRWYPLDGGIVSLPLSKTMTSAHTWQGFGRIRISLLFRSVETRLPPNILGWEVGTFEFTSPRILALGYQHNASIKLRTGGSTGKIGKSQAHALDEGDGYYWDLTKHGGKDEIKLPVKYRYRSPVILELHSGRKADGYAIIWLQHLVDGEDVPINIPIWKTKNAPRLIQNYITEENLRAKQTPGLEDIEEIGRLQFRGRFLPGMDESHRAFVSDNNSRETFETWEACLAEGVRTRTVEKETPEVIQELHEKSLTEGRDILKTASDREKRQWLNKTGTDWSGAFGHDPKAYVDSSGNKRREPGAEPPLHDPIEPSSDDDSDDSDDDSADLGVQDASNTSRVSGDTQGPNGTSSESGRPSMSEKDVNQQNKRTEERKHRGMMQWKPARNLKFAKDEGVIGLRKIKNKMAGGLEGRKPDVETETG